MAQYNLLSVCFKDKPATFFGIQNYLGINEYREKHRYKTYSNVSKELKDVIFTQLKKFTTRSISDAKNNLCTNCRRSFALLEHDYPSLDNWSTPKVEFDQKIILWHIATDLCYYLDFVENQGNVSSNCQESKHLSDYMLYLLVMYPFMLPMGIGMIRIRDTLAEAMDFFQEKNWKTEKVDQKAKACQKLLQVNTEVLPAKVKGDRSKSVLFDACRLAKSLHGMEKEQKWKVVSDAWVGMVAFAATHCRGNHHAQQLRKGGELLTHVWLLMAHLGITDQFQIDQGHARPKLSVK